MVVESVRVHMRTGRHVLLLKEVGAGTDPARSGSGPGRPSAIAMRLQGVAAGAAADPRPVRRQCWRRSTCAWSGSSSRRSPTRRSTPGWCWSPRTPPRGGRAALGRDRAGGPARSARSTRPAQVLDQAAALPDDDERDDDEDEEGGRREEARDARRSRLAAGSLEATGRAASTRPARHLPRVRELAWTRTAAIPRSGRGGERAAR